MDFGWNKRVLGGIRDEGNGLMIEFGGRELVSSCEDEKLLIGVWVDVREG